MTPQIEHDAQETDGRARRRVRTRVALLQAARELLAEGRSGASIKEITDRAGVGFGSFSNHFPGGKEELWTEAVLGILDRHTEWTMQATSGLTDAAEVFALVFRLTGRLAAEHPELMRPVLARGLSVVHEQRGLRAAAVAVLDTGEREGRFLPMARDLQVSTLGGALLGLIQLIVRDPDRGRRESVDTVAVAVLRFLGLEDVEARRIAGTPMPDLPPFSL